MSLMMSIPEVSCSGLQTQRVAFASISGNVLRYNASGRTARTTFASAGIRIRAPAGNSGRTPRNPPAGPSLRCRPGRRRNRAKATCGAPATRAHAALGSAPPRSKARTVRACSLKRPHWTQDRYPRGQDAQSRQSLLHAGDRNSKPPSRGSRRLATVPPGTTSNAMQSCTWSQVSDAGEPTQSPI